MGRKLVGWKEIAEVLRVHPRTAQEWEKQEGDMPVARPMGQRVFADEQELAAWWEQKRERGKLKPLEKDGKVTHRVFYTIVVVLLGLGAFFLWNYATLPGKPVTVRIDDGVIKILDEQGTLCFVIDSSGLHVGAYEKALANLSLPPEKPLKDRRLIFTDLEQNSSLETLFSEVSERSQEERSHLVCYEEDGDERWSFKYGRQLTLHGTVFSGIYAADFILPVLDGQFVLVVAHHNPRFATQVTLLNSTSGEPEDEYWHPGRMGSLLLIDLDGDGREELLMAGVNNPRRGIGHPALVALKIPFGPPDVTSGESNYFWPENSKEFSYILLPRFDVLEATESLAEATGLKVLEGGRVEVSIRDAVRIYGYYEFTQGLQESSFYPSDALLNVHQEMYLDKKLDHQAKEEEISEWGRVLRIDTAPDGNSVKIEEMFIEARKP